MFSKPPLVTICIISYNHAQFLPLTIESVLSQTYENQEVIIVDDGSKDGSLEIAYSFSQKFPDKVVVYTHQNNQNYGISATCNLGLRKAKGKYITWLGSDDLFLPDKISSQVKILEQDSSIGLVYSKAKTIDEFGNQTGYLIGKKLKASQDHLVQMLKNNLIPAPTILCRKECFERVGEYDENLIYSDWEMWIRILAHWNIAYLDKPTVLYRIHRTNTSVAINAEIDLKRKLDAVAAIERKIEQTGGKLLIPEIQNLLKKKPRQFEKEVSLCHLNNYFINCQRGELLIAISHLIKAIRTSPEKIILPKRLGSITKHICLSLIKQLRNNKSEC